MLIQISENSSSKGLKTDSLSTQLRAGDRTAQLAEFREHAKGPSASVRGPLFSSQHDKVQASAGRVGLPNYSLNGRFGKWYSIDLSNGCQLAPRPESITLKHDSFHYDSGTSPAIAFFNPWYAMRHSHPNEAFGGMFRRRRQIEITKKDLGNVVLERIGERQRLYFDHGADRIEIGEHLREPEREWLADVIKAWKTK